MSHEPQPFRKLLESSVSVDSGIRIGLALVVIAGGLAFLVLGVFLMFINPSVPYPHPVGARFLAVAVTAMGTGFLWIGVRLIRIRASSTNLLSPVARGRCSLIVGALGVCMLASAVEARNLEFLLNGAAIVLFSYWLFPLQGR